MESKVKQEHKYLPVLITILVMLFVVALIGGGVWYYAKQQAKKTADDNVKQVAALQKKIADLGEKTNSQKDDSNTEGVAYTMITVTIHGNPEYDQPFQEAVSQLGLNKDNITEFNFFGKDKAYYTIRDAKYFTNNSQLAYKYSGKWSVSQKSMQSVVSCEELNGVPEIYRPPCNSDSSGTAMYVDSNMGMSNYPTSQKVVYISSEFK